METNLMCIGCVCVYMYVCVCVCSESLLFVFPLLTKSHVTLNCMQMRPCWSSIQIVVFCKYLKFLLWYIVGGKKKREFHALLISIFGAIRSPLRHGKVERKRDRQRLGELLTIYGFLTFLWCREIFSKYRVKLQAY